MTIHVLINRDLGHWIFADQSAEKQTEFVCIDKNGNQIKLTTEDLDLKSFLQKKELEGYEQF